ncbi:snoRNA-binding rRNA-processing protein imp4 [Hanseniaspora valbyensis]
MLRRQARERREYLYKKAQELQQSQVQEKRIILKQALATGKPLPKELAEDSKLQENYRFDETATNENEEDIDDEYAELSGIQDPKIVVTTSRSPSQRLMKFSKELQMIFPNSIRLNRGSYIINDLSKACLSSNTTDLMIIHEHRGIPTSLTISHYPHGPTAVFSLHNVVLRHDIKEELGNLSLVVPHLIFEGFTTKLGQRVVTILKHLFPSGVKKDSSRVISFINKDDFISLRQHVYVKTNDGNVELAECGPRFEMRLYELKFGSVENKDADVEWQLRRFVRTANRKDYL